MLGVGFLMFEIGVFMMGLVYYCCMLKVLFEDIIVVGWFKIKNICDLLLVIYCVWFCMIIDVLKICGVCVYFKDYLIYCYVNEKVCLFL